MCSHPAHTPGSVARAYADGGNGGGHLHEPLYNEQVQ